jgi:transcription elongation factor Elf1
MSAPAEKEIDCNGTDEMVCPYCGHEQSESYEYLGDNKTQGTADCGECGKRMKWTAEYSVTYSTEQCKCLNGTPCEFKRIPHNSKEGEWDYLSCKECGQYKFIDFKKVPNELPKN